LMLLCMLLRSSSNFCNSPIPRGHTASVSSTYVYQQDCIATLCISRMRCHFDRLIYIVMCSSGTIDGVLDWRFDLLTT
jgi:hypothetical protein